MFNLTGKDLDNWIGSLLGMPRKDGETDEEYKGRARGLWYRNSATGPVSFKQGTYSNRQVYGLDLTQIEIGFTATAPQAKRDGQGSLLCQSCCQPFPYAEPAADGSFKCYGCRVSM